MSCILFFLLLKLKFELKNKNKKEKKSETSKKNTFKILRELVNLEFEFHSCRIIFQKKISLDLIYSAFKRLYLIFDKNKIKRKKY